MYTLPHAYHKFIMYFVKQQPIGFALLLIVSLVSAVSNTIWPFIISLMVDKINDYEGPKSELISVHGTLFMGALVFWLCIEVMMRARGLVMAYVFPKFEANIRMATYKYVSQHSHSYFISNYIGAIANRIADMPRSSSMIMDILIGQFMSLTIGIAISAYLLIQVHWTLATILVSWLLLHIAICWLLFQNAAYYSRVQSEARSLVQGKIVDSISNHLSIRLFSRYKYEELKLQETQNDEKVKYNRALVYIEKTKVLLGLLSIVGVFILFYQVIGLWQSELITLGNIVFVANLTLNMIGLIWVASDEMTYFFRDIGVLKQGLKVIQDPITVREHRDARPLIVTKGEIVFDNASFKYKRNNYIFRNMNVIIKGGQKVGLVGLSGSGKSTFAALILRLYELDAGVITIDGQEINKVTTDSLRGHISLIPQDPILFHRTIWDNIRYGSISASDEEILEASKLSHCHDFVSEFEDGYDTIVGEHGAMLSGGQKQRIAIARSMLSRSNIILLDEATSALDSLTEKYIQQSLEYLMSGKTSIIIAHRLSTLLNVDRILVFKKGEIIEDGSHAELIAKNGYYCMLWNNQHDGILPNEPPSE